MLEYVQLIGAILAIAAAGVAILAYSRNQAKHQKEEWQADLDRAIETLKETLRDEMASGDNVLSEKVEGFQSNLNDAQTTLREQFDERLEAAAKDVDHQVSSLNTKLESSEQRLDDRINAHDNKINEVEIRLRDKIDSVGSQAKHDADSLQSGLGQQIDAKYSELKVMVDLHSHPDRMPASVSA